MLRYEEPLEGHMVYSSNQHTDAHLQRRLQWKVYSSGWLDGKVKKVWVGPGGHTYLTITASGVNYVSAAYEPTGDLRRTTRLLRPGDRVRAYGGVRRASTLHPKVLNLEKFELISPSGRNHPLKRGTYISSPRANRHLTKPLIRYGGENRAKAGPVDGWLESVPIRPRARVRSR
jgi:tRNA(Ile2) C34 agmatinyltransferase TiaS